MALFLNLYKSTPDILFLKSPNADLRAVQFWLLILFQFEYESASLNHTGEQ